MAEKMITVVQTATFLRHVKKFFPQEEDLNELINYVALNPDAGVVAPEMGGCRKLRWPSKLKGAGKRGGYRVYFAYQSQLCEVWLLTVFTKSEKDDLTQREKNNLKRTA